MPGPGATKAAEKVRDVAAELLDIYAQRAAKAGFAFKHAGMTTLEAGASPANI